MAEGISVSNTGAPGVQHRHPVRRKTISTGFEFLDRVGLRAPTGRGRMGETLPATLISTFSKCGLHLKRPLSDVERAWLESWFGKSDYFQSHRRLSRGKAKRLCDEMGAVRGHVTDDGGRVVPNPVKGSGTGQTGRKLLNKPHTGGACSFAVSSPARSAATDAS